MSFLHAKSLGFGVAFPGWMGERPVSRSRAGLVCVTLVISVGLVVLWRRERWRAGPLLSRAVLRDARSAGVPACSRSLYYLPYKKNGFGSQAIRILHVYHAALRLEATYRFYPSRYWNYGCAKGRTWTCYFSAPSPSCWDEVQGQVVPVDDGEGEEKVEKPCPFLRVRDLKRNARWRCRVVGDATSEEAVHAFLAVEASGDDGLVYVQRLATALWRPNAILTRWIKREAPRTIGKDYIGVHVRRGDKSTEVDAVPLEQYAFAIRTIAESNRLSRVFLATDDFTVQPLLQEKLGNNFKVEFLRPARTRRGHLQNQFNHLTAKNRNETTLDMLTEMTLLAEASFFVCTFSSNFARFVHSLRDGKEAGKTISLDDVWSTGVAWRTFGSDYCSGPEEYTHKEYCRRAKAVSLVTKDDAL